MRSLDLFAQSLQKRENCPSGSQCLSVLPEVSANDNQLRNGLALAFGIFAAVAVLVIIIAAINFATAEGDADKISRAKKTIIYAVIGLIICLSAEAIVLTVIGRL
jgi:heme/copper-type cytochrome/quinol oxidase subunit 2